VTFTFFIFRSTYKASQFYFTIVQGVTLSTLDIMANMRVWQEKRGEIKSARVLRNKRLITYVTGQSPWLRGCYFSERLLVTHQTEKLEKKCQYFTICGLLWKIVSSRDKELPIMVQIIFFKQSIKYYM